MTIKTMREDLLINVEINIAIYTIINIYAPNNMNKRNTFFKQVDKFINEYSIGQIIRFQYPFPLLPLKSFSFKDIPL
jgi:hypothetical protein